MTKTKAGKVKSSKVVKKAIKKVVMIPCPDCTQLIKDGGLSQFKYPKAGLINENTHCLTCEGHGVVEE